MLQNPRGKVDISRAPRALYKCRIDERTQKLRLGNTGFFPQVHLQRTGDRIDLIDE